MPWVEVKEGHQEVETNCGAGANDQVCEDVVAEVEGGVFRFKLGDDDIDGGEDCVCHYYGVYYNAGHEHFLGSGGRLALSYECELALAYP